jgi:hypothetical protein
MLEIPIPGRSMELRHVWYFSATREAGSVVAAAAKLRVAQPAGQRRRVMVRALRYLRGIRSGAFRYRRKKTRVDR